jgi:CDP-diacylglycerol--glycerol-3-phosphate 3-phosphatidyltransferase
MVDLGRVPFWAVIIIIARELSITSLRVIAMNEGVVIAAGRGGKDKTALQMVALLMLIVHHSYELHFGFATMRVNFNGAGLVLFYLSVFFALTSAGEYIKLFVEAVEAKEQRLKQEDEGRNEDEARRREA